MAGDIIVVKFGSSVLRTLADMPTAVHEIYRTRGEWSRLVTTRASGEDVVVCGRGVERWPTTEAIIADLLDVRFTQLEARRRA